jgi:tetratricopeptide (TPR) repeat protein
MWRAVAYLSACSAIWAQAGADALFEKARAAQVAGRTVEAETAYGEYLKRYGPKAEVLANLGALLARREDYGEAIRRYKEALRLDPSLAPLHLNIGLAYLKQAQPGPAITEFDLFLKQQPGHRQAQQLRAMALLEAERYEDSERQYRALLPSSDATLTLGLATALLRQKKTAEAREVLDPVLRNANSPEVQFALGQLLVQEGRLDEALAALEDARRLNPSLPQLRVAIGSVYWRQGKPAEALQEWRAEYAAHPQSFEAAYMLGAALSRTVESREESEKMLRKAVELRPGNAQANFQLAKLVWQKSKDPEAAVYLDRATKADPEYREAFFLHATVLQALGRKAEAAKSFARVKELSAKALARQQDLFSETPTTAP